MAQAVEEALEEKRHLIVEAGTGTGKTLAYLLPVIRSGKRVIISTGTKNLQEQLFFKDVPALERALFPDGDRKLSVCYMKGRNNYLCRKKLYDLTDQPVLSGLEEIEHYRAIAAWEKTTQTGDRAELAELPEASALWHKLDARADTCLGQKCKEYDRCFITEMRRRAAESDIIIVNHHLFFADLSIKLEAEGAPDAGVLPECGAVIFDEAHELEEVAGNYFGISVSNLRMDELARDVEHLLQREKLYTPQMSGAIQSCASARNCFSRCCPRTKAALPSTRAANFWRKTARNFSPSINRCTAGRGTGATSAEAGRSFHAVRRAQQLQVQLRFVMENEDPNTVFWIERRGFRGAGPGAALKGRGLATPEKPFGDGASAPEGRPGGRTNVFLQATPIEVGQILRECLWSKLETSVLTSATLAVGGGFDYIKQRLGLDHARELIVPSHFDYESQAILYVPPDLPDPRTPQFAAEAASVIRRLLEITRGRAFVLFTSYAQMNDIYERLLGQLEFPMLKQGDAPKSALLEEFRSRQRRVVWNVVILAGRGRARRAVELRDYRSPALCRAQRSGGGGAGEGHRRGRRQRLLRIPGAERGHYAEAGVWKTDPVPARSRLAGAARQPDFEEAVRARVCRESCRL
jgi:ATP-dependent DNA helicase DinG